MLSRRTPSDDANVERSTSLASGAGAVEADAPPDGARPPPHAASSPTNAQHAANPRQLDIDLDFMIPSPPTSVRDPAILGDGHAV